MFRLLGRQCLCNIKGCRELVNQIVLRKRGTFEDEWDKSIPFYGVSGTTVKAHIFKNDERERFVHIYYSDYRKARERSKLETKIQQHREFLNSLIGSGVAVEKTYTEFFEPIYYHERKKDQRLQLIREQKDEISQAIKLCGYFAIITSSEMTASEALDLYKSRDCSEKLFRGDKSYLGERAMRVYQDKPLYVKIFIEFVALIIRNKIYTCLKDRMKATGEKANYMTVPAAIKELSKIEMVK